MKLLLDECLPLDLRHAFAPFEVHTVEWAGLKGKKNGELLRSAEAAGYDALLTVDLGMRFQQSLVGRRLSVVAIRARTNQLEDLLPLVPHVMEALSQLAPGKFISVGP